MPAPFAARVRALCDAHLNDPTFGVEQIAEAVALSDRHVRRRLRAETGEGPQAMLRRLRMERADGLLAAGARVESVARAVGYRDASAFRRAFRAVVGAQPHRRAGAPVPVPGS